MTNIKDLLKWQLLFLFLATSICLAQTNRYEPADGITIGIWPHNNRLKSLPKLKELKERWGFQHLLIAAIYGKKEVLLAKSAGFDSLHIKKQIYLPDLKDRCEWTINNIKETGKIGAYYFDEPISREHSIVDFLNLLTFLSNQGLYPHAKFVVSEINEYRAQRTVSVVDEIMYSGYGAKNKKGADQIKSWIEWKNLLGNKFISLWIGAHEDSDEYRELLKAAKEQNYKSIWFYQLEPIEPENEIDDSNFLKFCEAAVEFGFMKRIIE